MSPGWGQASLKVLAASATSPCMEHGPQAPVPPPPTRGLGNPAFPPRVSRTGTGPWDVDEDSHPQRCSPEGPQPSSTPRWKLGPTVPQTLSGQKVSLRGFGGEQRQQEKGGSDAQSGRAATTHPPGFPRGCPAIGQGIGRGMLGAQAAGWTCPRPQGRKLWYRTGLGPCVAPTDGWGQTHRNPRVAWRAGGAGHTGAEEPAAPGLAPFSFLPGGPLVTLLPLWMEKPVGTAPFPVPRGEGRALTPRGPR